MPQPAQRRRRDAELRRRTTSRRCATTSTCSPATATSTGNRIGPARSSCADPRRLVQRQPRIDLRPAADDLRPTGFSGIAFSTNVPHTVRGGTHSTTTTRMPAGHERNQDVHRLPRLEGQRQQRHHGAAADAGHELRELHRPLLLGRRRRARLFEASSSPSATSRRRSSAARCTSWRFPSTIAKHVERRPRAASTPTSIPARTSASSCCSRSRKPEILQAAGPRRVPLRGLRRGRPARLRHRLHRRQGVLRADHHGAGLARWASSSTCRRSTRRPSPRRRRSPPIRRAPSIAGEPGAAGPSRSTATSTSPTSTRG